MQVKWHSCINSCKKLKSSRTGGRKQHKSQDPLALRRRATLSGTIERQLSQKIEDGESRLNYEKMVANTNLTHPRTITQDANGIPLYEKLSLCTPVGWLSTPFYNMLKGQSQKYEDFDQLGLGLTLYFKMIKVLMIVLLFATLLSAPYMAAYASGTEALNWTGNEAMFGKYSLGNIGQSLDLCVKQDINSCDTVNITCPDNTQMNILRQYGIENKSALAEGLNSTCPLSLTNASAIELFVHDECKIEARNEKKEYNIFQEKVLKWFDDDCKGKNFCEMKIYSDEAFNYDQDTPKGYVNTKTCNSLINNGKERNTGSCQQVNGKDEDSKQIAYVVVQCQNQYIGTQKVNGTTGDVDSSHLEGNQTREQLAFMIVALDSVIMGFFLIVLWMIDYLIQMDIKRHNQMLVECNQFSVTFENLPKIDVDYTISRLKADLWEHIITVLNKKTDNIEQFASNIDNYTRNPEIVDIHFAYDNYSHLEYVNNIIASTKRLEVIDFEIHDLQKEIDQSNDGLQEGGREETEQQLEGGFPKLSEKEQQERKEKIAKLELEKQETMKLIEDNLSDYMMKTNEMAVLGQKQPVVAFVVFKAEVWQQASLSIFKMTWFQRQHQRLIKIKRNFLKLKNYLQNNELANRRITTAREHDDPKMFKGQWLSVYQSVDPQLIIWENYGIRGLSKFARSLTFWLFTFLFLILVFLSVSALERQGDDIGQLIPKTACPTQDKISEINAIDDFNEKNLKKRNGDWHCFCQYMYNINGTSATIDYEFKDYIPPEGEDSKTICYDWIINVQAMQTLAMGIPGMIGSINVGVEIIIGYGSEYISRPRNYQAIVLETMTGICGIQFINLGILFVIISVNSKNFLNVFGMFTGRYVEVNSAWFIEIGSLIVTTMVLEIGIPHGFPTMIMTVCIVMRWYDRMWSCDPRKSRKYLQDDYEELYVGTEFLLDARLAQVIAVVWATFMYSPSLPILYPICLVNLMNMYWVDKSFVLRFNKTPRNYDETIILKQVQFLKLTFPFHFVTGLMQLSLSPILESNSVAHKNETVLAANEWGVKNFGFNLLSDQFMKAHLITFIVVNLIYMTLLVFLKPINVGCLKLNCCKKVKNLVDKSKDLHKNFYLHYSVKFLISEYKRTKSEIQQLKEQNNNQNNTQDKNIEKLIKHLNNKKEHCAQRIDRFYQRLEKDIDRIEGTKNEKDIEGDSDEEVKDNDRSFTSFSKKLKQVVSLKTLDFDNVTGQKMKRDEAKQYEELKERINDVKGQDGKVSLKDQIAILEENIETTQRIKPTRMKSKTQTYDIRDSEELKGVLEIEQYLQTIKDTDQINQGMAASIRERLQKCETTDDKQDLVMAKTVFALKQKVVKSTSNQGQGNETAIN